MRPSRFETLLGAGASTELSVVPRPAGPPVDVSWCPPQASEPLTRTLDVLHHGGNDNGGRS